MRFSVAAAEQTAGRGRMARTFFSPADCGLYLSFVSEAGERFTRFGVLAALAVKELLYEYFRIPVAFKWPNDALKDIATSASLCCKNEELKLGFMQDKRAFLQDATVRLTELLSRAADLERAGEDLLPDYRASLATLGRRVSFSGADGALCTGVAADVDEDGALLVETAEGLLRVGWGEVAEQAL